MTTPTRMTTAANYTGFNGELQQATGTGTAGSLVDSRDTRLVKFALRMRQLPNRVFRTLLVGLYQGGSGSAVVYTHSRIVATTDVQSYGGSRAIETITDISRNTAASDISNMNFMIGNVIAGFSGATVSAAYPVDASANGGGSKVGF